MFEYFPEKKNLITIVNNKFLLEFDSPSFLVSMYARRRTIVEECRYLADFLWKEKNKKKLRRLLPILGVISQENKIKLKKTISLMDLLFPN